MRPVNIRYGGADLCFPRADGGKAIPANLPQHRGHDQAVKRLDDGQIDPAEAHCGS